jgi:ribosomal RNA-processing protein 36
LGEYKDKEIAALKAELKMAKAPSDGTELQTLLTKLQQQRAEELRKAAVRTVVRNQKKNEVDKISEGKRPYFLKKSALRDIAAATRFTELESKGDSAMEKAFKKRRKKLAAKDRKWLPTPSVLHRPKARTPDE